uniref:Vacuolar ATPase assembly protein VMA22 n=1 Tax=Musa acuminata subsp. malaccensis TaxID=214687 RepID=A0A804ISY8_MUSAM
MEDDDRCSSSNPGGIGQEEEDEDGKVLRFLDSLDSYLTLLDALSSTLRQGWFELASARHSMGSSRISSVLLDQKVQSAATTFQVRKSIDGSPSESHPSFAISKWASSRNGKCSFRELEVSRVQKTSKNSELRHRGSSNFYEEHDLTINASSTISDSDVQKERSKSLSVFGTLVSPKLRGAQVSFETALDAIVEIANIRSSMLSAFTQLQQEMKKDLG